MDSDKHLDGVDEAAEDGGDRETDYAATVNRHKKHYKILQDIRQLQENDISTISSALSVSRGVACSLLCRNHWNLSSVFDEWFANGDTIPEPVGIFVNKKSEELVQVCRMCYEKSKSENIVSAACGHPFCADCWRTCISASINDGPGCLTLNCPEPACEAAVCFELVDLLASAHDKYKYYQYLYRSYVESSRSRKWCPAPGCILAIEFDGDGCKSYDVTCDCSHKFCWKCTEECHHPVDCDTVAKWFARNSVEAANIEWILADTKSCPKCKREIEKNQGSNHMTCESPCEYQFCWLCLEPWNRNAHTSPSLYSCNKYEDDRGKDEKSGMNADEQLERYVYYYERWDSNDKSRKRSLVDLEQARNEHVDKLAQAQHEPRAQLQCVIEAWEQIVECRGVLKWSYAYGYYMSSTDRSLFELVQGKAEAVLERLHHCAEKEIDKYLQLPRVDFKDFLSKLASLTRVTRNRFEYLVRAMEKCLSKVESCCTNTSNRVTNTGTILEYEMPGDSLKTWQQRKRSKMAH